jgi:excisionase family DNA binding protein
MKKTPSIDPQQLAFTRASSAQATGLPLTTIDLAIANHELPATRSGRRLIILREDLIDWLRRGRERGAIAPRPPSQADKERLAELNRARSSSAV